MRQEVCKLKQFVNQYETEIEFYKLECETLKKEKDQLRNNLENFLKKNSTIEQSLKTKETVNLQNLQHLEFLEKIETLDIEKNKIQVIFLFFKSKKLIL